MAVFVVISLALSLGMLAGILLHGYTHVRESQRPYPARPLATDGFNREDLVVDVIVPVTGNSPELRQNLHSFLNQDLPQYRTFLVTKDRLDPAVPVIEGLLKKHEGARHIIAGHATRCGQKNFNLLAGIEAAGRSDGILVFCDSSHHAPSTLLRDLITPLLHDEETLTTGFHRIIPGDSRIATLGMMISVTAIHLLQGNKAFTQPWGGATAIRRDVFMEYGIDRLWAETVVDDFTMGPSLRRHGIRCRPVSSACLTTPLAGENMSGWVDWLTRQLLYMKYYTPWEWLGASLAAYLLVAPILLSLMAAFGFFLGFISLKVLVPCLIYFLIWSAMGVFTRRKFLKRSPPFRWLFTFYSAHFVACWCYIRTWFLNTISWRGISYKMSRKGRVREVILDKVNPRERE
jgi:cellulose synthase/poly-beta-1,6-N-acetylglucosamine synthase-like glycosyltransferase